jgi:predicted RND superfamily exporter protein
MFILIAIILSLYFRSIIGTFIPLVIVVFTTVEAVGFMSYMGFEFNSILGAIPGVLLGICLADAIHVLTVFYQELSMGKNKVAALKISLTKNFVPTILTTLTTAISFLSISFTDLVPIHDLGQIAFFGTLMAWINTYLLIPSLILLLPAKFSINKKKPSQLLRVDFSHFILKYKYFITFGYLILTVIAFLFCFRNEANSDPLKYFTPDTKIRKDFVFAEKQLGSIRILNVVIDSGEVDGIKNPMFLKNVDSFLEEIEKFPFVSKVSSAVGIVKDINKNLHDGDSKYFSIPSDRDLIAETLFLYTLGAPPELGLGNKVTSNNQQLNIRVNWLVDNTKDSMNKNDQIKTVAKKWGLNAKEGGTFSVYAGVNDKVVSSFFRSIFLAVFMVSFVLLVVFKKPMLSLLAMLPNLIPLIFVGAYTAISRIYIDVGASIVFTICLGIAVDDTIHFLSHYMSYIKEGKSLREALRLTFITSGEAILLTTLVLIVGFGSFVLADFLPNKNFGVLSSSVLFLAVFTDLIFLPSILAIISKSEVTNG